MKIKLSHAIVFQHKPDDKYGYLTHDGLSVELTDESSEHNSECTKT
jgi:hypothetical protein